MKKTQIKKLLSFAVCIVLIAAMALFASGCNDKADGASQSSAGASQVTDIGEGSTKFDFIVVDADGKETKFCVSTDKKTVGEALLSEGLIAGEDSSYGLYVKTVNGITLDYDTDGMYWSFYINGDYAMTGVDSADVVSGAEYMLKAER